MSAMEVPQAFRILVCDDERPIVRLLQAVLERQGYEVVCAYDGVDALERLRQERFDLVLLDVMMPRIDGIQVLRWVKQNPATAHIPVYILSVKSQDSEVFEGYHSGASLYLTKPFNVVELLQFISREA
jgi:CheY-like chemotaxis protein